MNRWLWVALVLASCKREVNEICDLSAAQIAPAERDAHHAQCMETVEKLKPGFRDCVLRCYKTATGREALFDCDTKCSVHIQTP